MNQTYTKLKLMSPPSFAFNSSSTSKFSPMFNLAGFFSPFLPDLDDDGIGGRPPKPDPPAAFALSTLASAFCLLLLRRRRRRRPLLVVPALLLVGASEWPEMEVVSLMRRPDMSMWRGLPVVLVTGTGPPGPPRLLRGPEIVLPGEEDFEDCFGLAAVSGEEGIVEERCVCVCDGMRWRCGFRCRWGLVARSRTGT